MPDAAARILAELSHVRERVERMDERLERLPALAERVAVLETKSTTDHGQTKRLERRVDGLDEVVRGLAALGRLASEVEGLRQALEAWETRIGALETERAKRAGQERAILAVWAMLTAAPGLASLAITLGQLW